MNNDLAPSDMLHALRIPRRAAA